MNVLFLIISFLIYSFMGWMIDTAGRSWTAGKYTTGSFFPVPLCPIYGFGALGAIFLHHLFGSVSIIMQGIIFAFLLSLLEYSTGFVTLKVFHRRMWNYPTEKTSDKHFTDLPHAILWGVLAILTVQALHPFLHSLFLKVF